MKRVVVTDWVFPNLDPEEAAARGGGAVVEAHQCRSAAEVRNAVQGADVAVVQLATLDAEAIGGLAPGARVVRYGVGFDNIDVAAARERGVGVAYVPDYCTDEVADHTATLLLALVRRIVPLDASVRAGRWESVKVMKPTPALGDTVVGFLGLGRIGRAVMARLKPFGFRFRVLDPALSPEALVELGAEGAADLAELLAVADALTLHVPSTPATRRILNAESFALMKPGAALVNTARGDLVDPAVLAEALESGRLRAAALDVFEAEPLPADSALRAAPNLVLSSHAAWYSDRAIGRLQTLAADEIARALAGRPPRCPVPGC